MGKRKGPGQKPQIIIVKFTRYKGRHHVFRNESPVTESLTLKRMEHLKKARKQHTFAIVWTHNEKIRFKGNDGNPKVYYS